MLSKLILLWLYKWSDTCMCIINNHINNVLPKSSFVQYILDIHVLSVIRMATSEAVRALHYVLINLQVIKFTIAICGH